MALRNQLEQFIGSCELLLANLQSIETKTHIQIYNLRSVELTKKQCQQIAKYEKTKKSNVSSFIKHFKVQVKESSLSERYKILKYSKEELFSEIHMLKYELAKNKKTITNLRKIEKDEARTAKQLAQINSQVNHQEKSLLRRFSISQSMKEKLREIDHKLFELETQIIKMETNAVTQKQTLETRKKWQTLDSQKQQLVSKIRHINQSHEKAQKQLTESLMNKGNKIHEINETIGQVYLQLKEQRQIIEMIMEREGVNLSKEGKELSSDESIEVKSRNLKKKVFLGSKRKSQTEESEELFPVSQRISFKVPEEIKKKNKELRQKRKSEEIKSMERYKRKNLTEVKRHPNVYPYRYSQQLADPIFQNRTKNKITKTRYSFESSSPTNLPLKSEKERSSFIDVFENLIERNKEGEEDDRELKGLKVLQKNKKRFKRYMIKEKKIMQNRESDEEKHFIYRRK